MVSKDIRVHVRLLGIALTDRYVHSSLTYTAKVLTAKRRFIVSTLDVDPRKRTSGESTCLLVYLSCISYLSYL